MSKPHQPPDDPSSAPESGTVRDDSNLNSSPPDRGAAAKPAGEKAGEKPPQKDDPSTANEEK